MSKHGLMTLGRTLLLFVTALSWGCDGCSSTQYKDAGVSDASADRPVDGPKDGGPSACTTKPDTGSGTKALGEACACGFDCESGFCADGVCCNKACGESCMTCSLPSSRGTCTFVPAGEADSEASCKKESAATCGQDGFCDGKGGCEKYPAETMSSPGKCDGNAVSGGYVCDGNGQAVLGPVVSCAGFACDPSTNTCLTSCKSNADCAPGQQCKDGSCGLKPIGYPCGGSAECASGFCVDNVCCNTSCNTPCLSCNQTGYAGHCRLLAANALDPQCNGQDPSTCGNTGRCDAFGSCAKWPATTVCKAASCAATTLTTQALCDGNGTCGTQGVQECSPFLCQNGGCTVSCTSDDQCAPDHQCTVGADGKRTCGKKKNGGSCKLASDCESNFCVDGVCCNNACQGACRRCDMAGPSKGTCTSVAAGEVDPRKTCNDNGASSCDLNGRCDGSGACQKYPAGTACAPESCKNGAYTEASQCNASHQCVAGASQSCAPYACNGAKCATICGDNTSCVAPNMCDVAKHSCGLKPPGAQCASDTECGTGHCAQGVCCNTTCTGACNACNLTGKMGTCSAVESGADPQGKCQVSAATSCGTTGLCKAGACAYWDTSTTCKDASCPTSGTAIAVSKCNGAGQCVTPAATNCAPYTCIAGVCGIICLNDMMCLAPATCQGISCGKKPPGAACGAAAECQSNFCTEGVCCDSACSDGASGLCQSCKVAGNVGKCTPVPAGGADPKSRCPKGDPATGDCADTGMCNGAGACAPYPTGTTCSTQSCAAGQQHNTGLCNASGACAPQPDTPCAPYVCDATGLRCLMTCTSNANCAAGITCNLTTNKCGDKLPNGATCAVATDCLSNICSGEGVCCDSACTDGCSTCLSATAKGTCTPVAKGTTPRDGLKCPAATATSGDLACGNTGKCDGVGGCELAPATKTCGAASCPSGGTTETSVRTCTGTGQCAPPTTHPCGGFVCDPAAMSCKISCTSATAATDCAPTYSCINGNCQKKPNGTACSAADGGADCASGNCVDGACCDKPATMCGACKSCATGTCTNVAPGGTDAACVASATATCGLNGTCDGAGSCAYWAAGTSCRAAGCLNGTTAIAPASCPGAGGGCPIMTTTPCATGYACVGTACAASCQSNLDCAPGYTCQGTSCLVPPPPTGGSGPGTGGDMGSGGMPGTGGDAMGGAGGAG